MFRTKLFTHLGFFLIFSKKCRFVFIKKPCCHIEFNTTNPNPILTITICFTKTPKQKQNTFQILKSKSTVYPPKQTRTDVSRHGSGADFRRASFITNLLFLLFTIFLKIFILYFCIYIYLFLYIYIYVHILHIFIFVYIYIYVHLYIFIFIHIFIYLYIYLFECLVITIILFLYIWPHRGGSRRREPQKNFLIIF